MIDGLPAFPDEEPPGDWRELRVATDAGMVTISRGERTLTCVVWGNADAALNLAMAKVLWACASAAGGRIDGTGGSVSPDEFARESGLSPA